MFHYLTTFVASLLFTFGAQYQFNKKQNKIGWLLSVFAIMIPCVLAGLRAESVGIDVKVYAKPEYLKAIQCSSFFQYLPFSSCEPLYSLLVYCCAKVGDSVNLLLFVTQLLTITPVYLSAYLHRKTLSMPMVMMGYLFIYYNLSLSIMRQSVSMAIVMLVFSIFYTEHRFSKKLIPLIIVAGLFHYFSFFVFGVLFVVEFIIRSKRNTIQKGIVILLIVAIMMNIRSLTLLLANLLPAVFGKYVLVLNQINYSGFSFSDTVLKLAFLVLCILPRHRIDGEDKQITEKYTYMFVLGFVFQVMAYISEYLLRISFYFQFFMILPLGTVKYAFAKKDKYIITISFAIFSFLYWYIVYINWGWHGTYPYEFR